MGIRFYCPNGHKLNVKAFLAGKRGICPHCDARFAIPFESQIPADAPRIRGGQPTSSASPAVQPLAALLTEDEEIETVGDPIAEAPNAVWYVRPPAGGQYGPARGELMHRWLVEGRVCPDCLVWREGWSDWKLAGHVFPQVALPASGAAPVSDPAPPADAPPVLQDLPAAAPLARTPQRSGGRGKSIAAVVFLALLIVVLVVMLVVVLQRGA